MNEKDDIKPKLQAIIITLCTIIVGLSSYIYYISSINKDPVNQRCEYNGWAYANGETFPDSDDCNTCICSNGEVVCTEMACIEETSTCGPEEDYN